ncbi:hypothetical protein C8Q75DRAFT_241000 [Abortiporus biennis]|nr:hypothetical protein C8Q75DRAFT_241000 [Abortiporus biennis]
MTSNYEFNSNDDHLRYLLDQRAARADLHGHFPSQSDFSDSPSLYSHNQFSPQPYGRSDVGAGASSSYSPYVTSPTQYSYSSEPRSPVSDRERLNFPEASSLDLDDDPPRSSYDYSTAHEDLDSSTVEEDERFADADEGDSEGNRISTYGPKMRFHSRAPWELDEDGEEDTKRGKKKADKSSSKADSQKKAWALGTRHNPERRPSVDSARSHGGKPKQSFDTVSSITSTGGALLALAQASMSSTSLAMAPSPQSSFRDKLSLPRLRSRTTSSTKAPSLDNHNRPGSPNFSTHSTHPSPISRLRATSPTDSIYTQNSFRPSLSGPPSPHTPQHQSTYRHPYANPDFAREPSLDDLHQQHHDDFSASPAIGRSNSSTTLTDSNSLGSNSHFTSSTTVTLTPVTSLSSVQSKMDSGSRAAIQNRGISSPAHVSRGLPKTAIGSPVVGNSLNAKNDAKLVSGGLTGWGESGNSSIKLISLQEAQAQARERSRTATTSNATSSVASPQVRSMDWDPLPSPGSQPGNSWPRLRSQSAGSTKNRNLAMSSTTDLAHPVPVPPLPSEMSLQQVDQPAVPQKTVVRKKSGFMRLFNGKERSSALPPVPPLSINPVPPSLHITPSPASPIAAARKGVTHRVPVPSITPSLLDPPNSATSNSSSESRSDHGQNSLSSHKDHPKKNPYGLSIITSSSSGSQSSKTELHPDMTRSVMTPTTGTDSNMNSSISSSAPPSAENFVGLSLRPVSTIFSHNFADQFAARSSADQNRPSLDADHGTPTTATTIVSPLSPAFPNKFDGRSSDEKGPPVGIAAQQEDQSAVIQALQDQILSARRAWQRQIWELEGQVRDLKQEVEDLRSIDKDSPYCAACGRGGIGRPGTEHSNNGIRPEELAKAGVKVGGVVNRPRARTGVGSRFASGT